MGQNTPPKVGKACITHAIMDLVMYDNPCTIDFSSFATAKKQVLYDK